METMTTSTPAQEERTQNYFQKNKTMILILIFLLFILFALITYIFIYTRPTATGGKQAVTPEPTPIVSSPVVVSPTPQTATTTSSLPSGWTLKESAFCKISLPVPPNNSPYTEPIEAAGLTKIWETEFDQSHSSDPIYSIFTGFGRALLRFPGGVNGADAPTPDVEVYCLPNATSDEGPGLLAMMDTQARAMGGSAVLQKTETLWGTSVSKILLNFGQTHDEVGYAFVKNGIGYYVRKIEYPYTSPYNDYAQTIFENIQFN